MVMEMESSVNSAWNGMEWMEWNGWMEWIGFVRLRVG